MATEDKQAKQMKELGFRREYLLNQASVLSLWNEITTPQGLSEWFAEQVDITGKEVHVFWDLYGDDRQATIVELNEPQIIKWIWDDDPKSFLSMEILQTELSKTVSLLVEDYDINMERGTLERIWEGHIEKLMSALGLH